MANFNTTKLLCGSPALIPSIAGRLRESFQADGYEVVMDALSSGGYDISITKGSLFKAVLGMRTALKITLLPQGSNIHFEAGVGIWGQQAIPTIISMFFLWPVLLTQIWGLIEQSQLDDRALEIAESVIGESATTASHPTLTESKFCTSCGTRNDESANFCCACGKKM